MIDIKTIIPTVISCLYFTLNSDQFITNKLFCLLLILLSSAVEVIYKAANHYCYNKP
jgi:hypothetical protein